MEEEKLLTLLISWNYRPILLFELDHCVRAILMLDQETAELTVVHMSEGSIPWHSGDGGRYSLPVAYLSKTPSSPPVSFSSHMEKVNAIAKLLDDVSSPEGIEEIIGYHTTLLFRKEKQWYTIKNCAPFFHRHVLLVSMDLRDLHTQNKTAVTQMKECRDLWSERCHHTKGETTTVIHQYLGDPLPFTRVWEDEWERFSSWKQVGLFLQRTHRELTIKLQELSTECDDLSERLLSTDILESTLRMNRRKQQILKDTDKLRFLQKKMDELSLLVYSATWDAFLLVWLHVHEMKEWMTRFLQIKFTYEEIKQNHHHH